MNELHLMDVIVYKASYRGSMVAAEVLPLSGKDGVDASREIEYCDIINPPVHAQEGYNSQFVCLYATTLAARMLIPTIQARPYFHIIRQPYVNLHCRVTLIMILHACLEKYDDTSSFLQLPYLFE